MVDRARPSSQGINDRGKQGRGHGRSGLGMSISDERGRQLAAGLACWHVGQPSDPKGDWRCIVRIGLRGAERPGR
jgi:hypothetical protein